MRLNKQSYFKFAGGEVHCHIEDTPFRIIMQDFSMDGFMALAQHVEVLRTLGKPHIDVFYPYLPYARQDRIIDRQEPFSLKVFCKLLNSLELNSVWVYDPHSDVGPALINKCQVVPQWEIARSAIPQEYLENNDIVFVSPDAGAYKKLAKLITNDKRIAIGAKERGTDGKILRTNVYYNGNLEGATCFIVDDICDGGRTFIELAKALRENGAKKILLYITHGIFSQGFEELQKHIDHIYTTNTLPTPGDAPKSYVTVHEAVC